MTHIVPAARQWAEKYPFILFVSIAYAWSWPFWWAVYFFEFVPGMKHALVLLGVFGPALAGVAVMRLRDREPREPVPGQWRLFLLGMILALLAVAAFRYDVAGVMALVPDNALEIPAETPWYVYLLFLAVALLSGFVFSQVKSQASSLRTFLSGLIPNRRTLVLAVPVLLFLPALMVCANVISGALGLPSEVPMYQQISVSEWLPLMIIKLFTVAILTGGNEEYGWRGVLLPLLQSRYSPLVATILLALVWEPWHIPLTIEFSAGGAPHGVVLLARFFMIFPIAFMMTMLYNFSGGSIFLCVLLHASFNTSFRMFAGSPLFALGLFMTVALGIILFKMWRKGSGVVPGASQA